MLFSASLLAAQTSQKDASLAGDERSSTPVTVTGCVARQTDSSAHPVGSETPGGGTVASTNAGAAPTGAATAGSVNRGEPAGLLLIVTRTAAAAPPASAVPGSTPSATDTGTIPTGSLAGTSGRTQSRPTAFRLVFGTGQDGIQYMGQRLQVTGTVAERGSDRRAGETVARGGDDTRGTRSEVSSTAVAHPSSDLPTLTVQSFSVQPGRCDAAQPTQP